MENVLILKEPNVQPEAIKTNSGTIQAAAGENDDPTKTTAES